MELYIAHTYSDHYFHEKNIRTNIIYNEVDEFESDKDEIASKNITIISYV